VDHGDIFGSILYTFLRLQIYDEITVNIPHGGAVSQGMYANKFGFRKIASEAYSLNPNQRF
jgi:hypothetical protein